MEKMTYEQAIKRLEEIIKQLENNEIPLEDSISLFQEGVELSQFCDNSGLRIVCDFFEIYYPYLRILKTQGGR